MPGSQHRHIWTLDPDTVFLNHGSFGACPQSVLQTQADLSAQLERQPVRFLVDELPERLDHARQVLADFLEADAEDLAFVPNATTGISTVLRSLRLQPNDELLTTSHAYNAVKNAMRVVAEQQGARLVIADLPFPIAAPEQIVERIMEEMSERTRLVVLDHITSPTALIFPVEALVSRLQARGVDVLIDGSHAPGMVPLSLKTLGAAYYTGNCHKWLCAPKGSAFLHVRRDRQAHIRPLSLSHGANSTRTDRTRFQLEFDWTGTSDPTPFLCVPAAIDALASLIPGGMHPLMQANHVLALRARAILCEALQLTPPAPDHMLGSMATIVLPISGTAVAATLDFDPLRAWLRDHHGIEVPVWSWPTAKGRLLRVSAQQYNHEDEYRLLATALGDYLAEQKAKT